MTLPSRSALSDSQPDARPRVCLLVETYAPEIGGGETQARLVAEGLAARGFPIFIVTRRSRPELPKRSKYCGIAVLRVPLSGRGQLRKWSLFITVLPTLFRHRREIDVLVVGGFRILGVPAILFARLFGKRCLLKAESTGEMSGAYFKAGLEKWGLDLRSLPVRAFLSLRNVVLRRGECFVSMSGSIHRELAEAGIPSDRIESIPNCVDADRFRPPRDEERAELRRALELPPDAPVAIYTGRLVSYKGLPVLLRVWSQVVGRHSSAVLLLVGGGSEDLHNCEAELRTFVAESGLGPWVRFAGPVERPEDYLRASDIFVFPSEDEAFGLALVEAMACGLPAVTTTVGGLADIARHEENSLVVTPGDAAELDRALDRLLTSVDLRSRLGRRALQDVTQRFTQRTVLDRYAALCHTAREARSSDTARE